MAYSYSLFLEPQESPKDTVTEGVLKVLGRERGERSGECRQGRMGVTHALGKMKEGTQAQVHATVGLGPGTTL